MSAKLFETDILFLQRFLMVSGFYNGPLDRKWSTQVDAAEASFSLKYDEIKSQQGTFDNRSESNILTLIPSAQVKAREFMKAAANGPLTYRIISGTRTYAEQDSLYAIGRTVQIGARRVTNAKGGQSNHNFGIAWDVGIFDGGKYLTGDTPQEDKAYVDLGKLIKQNVPGVEWGGDWTSFVDKPHYQLATGKSVDEVRVSFEDGEPFAELG